MSSRVSCLTPLGLRLWAASTSLDRNWSLSNVAMGIEASTGMSPGCSSSFATLVISIPEVLYIW